MTQPDTHDPASGHPASGHPDPFPAVAIPPGHALMRPGWVRLVIVSDTHGQHDLVSTPPGDVLVHTGDFSAEGGITEITAFLKWFAARDGGPGVTTLYGTRRDYAAKVLIAGNHDRLFENVPATARGLIPQGVTYMERSGATICGLRFWGAPETPAFKHWAFNRDDDQRRRLWRGVPEGTDVLLTHGPPQGVLDRTLRGGGPRGCEHLKEAVWRTRPQVHAFGHLHESRGHGHAPWPRHGGAKPLWVNASVADGENRVKHPAYVVDVPLGGGQAIVVSGAGGGEIPVPGWLRVPEPQQAAPETS